jgi:guanine deaminase
VISAFRAEILAVPEPGHIVHHPDGLLIVEDGIIVSCAPYSPPHDIPVTHFPGKTIIPGFVDAHVHYPQTERIAAHGSQLLEWLDKHIFPAEIAFADRGHSDRIAAFFLDELLRNGTTSALVYATVHAASVDALFEAALTRNMRIVSGKVLMDRDAPDGLRDTVASGRADSEALIARWRGKGRLGYAVTPRFALTSTFDQLVSAGEMVAAHPDVLMHTHMAENRGEVAAVAERFPDSRDYLDAYDRFGLVGPRSVFAHCIHCSDDMFDRMAAKGAHAAFCPTSNLFLGSGLFDLARATAHGVGVAIGTDIGAGTSFSILHTLGEAYKVCQMRGDSLDPFRALHLATVGGARALGIADRVGALQAGQEADFIVLDPAATPLLARRTAGLSLHDKLFALQILGDDRTIAFTYVAGQLAHQRDR